MAKTQDGTTVFDKADVKKAFYQEFKERWAASDKPLPQRHQLSGKFGQELDQKGTMEELNMVIQELKLGKAVGLDGVSPDIVKSMTEHTRRYILAFVNKCVQDRRMPEELKKGQVKLMFKSEYRRVPKNYRPICVNSILAS